jgi:hypothetical protein
VCVICQNAPALLVGAPAASLALHRVHRALRRQGPYDDGDAWAAAARGELPPEPPSRPIGRDGRGQMAATPAAPEL